LRLTAAGDRNDVYIDLHPLKVQLMASVECRATLAHHVHIHRSAWVTPWAPSSVAMTGCSNAVATLCAQASGASLLPRRHAE
jgi:hypothetical protein